VNSIRLVDVQDKRNVEFCPTPRYFALSYVEGKWPYLHYSTANENSPKQEGGLARVQLLQTIEDATTFVSKLGDRYLWIDALCILQDDSDDTKVQKQRVSYIYSNAVVTVTAGVGDSVEAGLSRLSSPANSAEGVNELACDLERIGLGAENLSGTDSSVPTGSVDSSGS